MSRRRWKPYEMIGLRSGGEVRIIHGREEPRLCNVKPYQNNDEHSSFARC